MSEHERALLLMLAAELLARMRDTKDTHDKQHHERVTWLMHRIQQEAKGHTHN